MNLSPRKLSNAKPGVWNTLQRNKVYIVVGLLTIALLTCLAVSAGDVTTRRRLANKADFIKRFEKMDRDTNGQIDIIEFYDEMVLEIFNGKEMPKGTYGELETKFGKEWDKDGNGFISPDEFGKAYDKVKAFLELKFKELEKSGGSTTKESVHEPEQVEPTPPSDQIPVKVA